MVRRNSVIVLWAESGLREFRRSIEDFGHELVADEEMASSVTIYNFQLACARQQHALNVLRLCFEDTP
jgi:hypothetical protein